jgi:hypothetical protein
MADYRMVWRVEGYRASWALFALLAFGGPAVAVGVLLGSKGPTAGQIAGSVGLLVLLSGPGLIPYFGAVRPTVDR